MKYHSFWGRPQPCAFQLLAPAVPRGQCSGGSSQSGSLIHWTSTNAHCARVPHGAGLLGGPHRDSGLLEELSIVRTLKILGKNRVVNVTRTLSRGAALVALLASPWAAPGCANTWLWLCSSDLGWLQSCLATREQLQKHEVNRDVPAFPAQLSLWHTLDLLIAIFLLPFSGVWAVNLGSWEFINRIWIHREKAVLPKAPFLQVALYPGDSHLM